MKTTTSRRMSGLLTTIVAALAIGLGLGAAAPAHAARTNEIDLSRDGDTSITVHKYVRPSGASPASDGTELDEDAIAATPRDGIEFHLYRVDGIDLTSSEGWEKAAEIVSNQNSAAYNVNFSEVVLAGTPYPMVEVRANSDGSARRTADGGKIVFDELPFGLYVVREGADHSVEQDVVSSLLPYLVTTPLPLNGSTEWIYDVHTYPKNSAGEITKNVDDSQANVAGDLKHWTVASRIPVITEALTELVQYTVEDSDMDERLELVNTEERPIGVQVVDAAGSLAAEQPVEGDDYVLTWSASGWEVDFTDIGLDLLEDNQGGNVIVSFSTKLLTSFLPGELSGIIQNYASCTVNGKKSEAQQTTVWSEILIRKHAAGDSQKVLVGAVFRLCADKDCASVLKEGITTGEDGTARLSVKAEADAVKSYWVQETAAPVGFVLDTTIREVQVTSTNVGEAAVQVDVANNPEPEEPEKPGQPEEPGNPLAVTGGKQGLAVTGADAAILGGIAAAALLLIGSGAALRRRNNRED